MQKQGTEMMYWLLRSVYKTSHSNEKGNPYISCKNDSFRGENKIKPLKQMKDRKRSSLLTYYLPIIWPLEISINESHQTITIRENWNFGRPRKPQIKISCDTKPQICWVPLRASHLLLIGWFHMPATKMRRHINYRLWAQSTVARGKLVKLGKPQTRRW